MGLLSCSIDSGTSVANDAYDEDKNKTDNDEDAFEHRGPRTCEDGEIAISGCPFPRNSSHLSGGPASSVVH